MDKNKVQFGLSKVHYAMYTPGTGGAAGTYSTPKPIPGAVTFAPKPQNDAYSFFADNGEYFTHTKDNGDAGDLEMALFPEEFLIDVLGWERDTNGALVEVANKTQKPFALLFQVEGDQEPLNCVYYHTMAAKPSQDFATTQKSTEVKTQKISVTMIPVTINGRSFAKISVTESGAPSAFAGFFSEVYQPTFGATP